MGVIPEDRCERCIAELGEVWQAGRDRVCSVCAYRAHGRGEDVVRVDPPAEPDCPHCHGLPLEPRRINDDWVPIQMSGADRQLLLGRCGVCTPLPPGAALDD